MVKNLLSDIPAVPRPNGPYCKRVKDSIATRPIEVEQGVVTPIDFSVSHSIIIIGAPGSETIRK